MVFKIPAPAGHLKKNRFEFDLEGETLSLPKMEYVPSEADDWLRDMIGKRLQTREYVIGFATACDAAVGGKLAQAKFSRDQWDAFYTAWQEASKVTEGESSNSSKS